MAGVNNSFDFTKYDIGGKGAVKGDNKLTGEEVKRARADGWNVWEGMTPKYKPGKMNESMSNDFILVPKQPGGCEAEYISREQVELEIYKTDGKKLMSEFIQKYIKQK